MELKSHMTAAVDTKTCRRRNRLVNPFSPILICDPLGDQNVYHLNIGRSENLEGTCSVFNFPKRTIVFCYQNCSDLEQLVQTVKGQNNFW